MAIWVLATSSLDCRIGLGFLIVAVHVYVRKVTWALRLFPHLRLRYLVPRALSPSASGVLR